jgi:hypothetical protein
LTHEDSGLQLITIRRSLGKSIKLDVVLKGKRLNAVIDTAAMITLINERFIAPHKLVSAELIKLKGLGSQIVHSRLLKDIGFEIGPLHVSWDCCAVPMEDEMIIGLDFLESNHGVINIKEGTLSLEGKTFPIELMSNPHEGLHSSLVRIRRSVYLPPNTITKVLVQLDNPLSGEYIVSPVCMGIDALG